MPGNIYWDSIGPSIPRLIGLIDRNPASKTYGCCDRTYWHYKTVDFPSARYQEAALTLALLYSKNFEGNDYCRNHQVLEWCLAIINYWAGMQEANGSFNEWYPHESSFVATTYSVYAVSEALLVLKASVPENICAALEKAARWLMKTTETRVANQEAGSAVALYNIYLLTLKEEYKIAAERKVMMLLGSQDSEGWWKEYTGPDVGYLSLMTSFLAKYYEKSGDEAVPKALEKSFDFLSYMIHPDMSVGGVYGCRNTAYFIPYGVELLAKKIPAAAIIAAHLRQAISKRLTISPLTLDDRYLAYTGYEWLQAEFVAEKISAKKPPFQNVFSKDFTHARIFVKSTLEYYIIINYGKGGAFLISFNDGKSYSDGGCLLSCDGKHYGAGYVDRAHEVTFMDASLKVHGPLYVISSVLPSSGLIFMFRVAQSILGRIGSMGFYIKKVLRDKLISGAKPSGFHYYREFSMSERKVTVKDRVDAKCSYKLSAGIPLNFIYVPSTNFFEKDQLNSTQSSSAGELVRTYSLS
jgi:hypothetical protein